MIFSSSSLSNPNKTSSNHLWTSMRSKQTFTSATVKWVYNKKNLKTSVNVRREEKSAGSSEQSEAICWSSLRSAVIEDSDSSGTKHQLFHSTPVYCTCCWHLQQFSSVFFYIYFVLPLKLWPNASIYSLPKDNLEFKPMLFVVNCRIHPNI